MVEFSGKLTNEDLDDLAVLLRPRRYWLSLALGTWHGAALFATIVWTTILGILGRTSPSWLAMAIIWVDDERGAAAVVLSVAEMPELERQRLRDYLRSQVHPSPPRKNDRNTS